MKYVALLSGGKDSCFNLLHCKLNDHELIAAASLRPSRGSMKGYTSWRFCSSIDMLIRVVCFSLLKVCFSLLKDSMDEPLYMSRFDLYLRQNPQSKRAVLEMSLELAAYHLSIWSYFSAVSPSKGLGLCLLKPADPYAQCRCHLLSNYCIIWNLEEKTSSITI